MKTFKSDLYLINIHLLTKSYYGYIHPQKRSTDTRKRCQSKRLLPQTIRTRCKSWNSQTPTNANFPKKHPEYKFFEKKIILRRPGKEVNDNVLTFKAD